MCSLEARLPHMVVRVDEARRDDFPCAINHAINFFPIYINIRIDSDDDGVLNEQVGNYGLDEVIVAMNKKRPTFQECRS